MSFLSLLLLPALPAASLGDTLIVYPDGHGTYPTIQAAIDASDPWDTIALAPGVFRGAGNRDLLIDSEDSCSIASLEGPEMATLDGEGRRIGSCSSASVSFRQLAFLNCDAVSAYGADVDFTDCVFDSCIGAAHGGYSGFGFLCCEFRNCTGLLMAASESGGISATQCVFTGCHGPSIGGNSFDAVDCVFEDNSNTLIEMSDFSISAGSGARFERCQFLRNVSSPLIFLWGVRLSLIGCTFGGNAGALVVEETEGWHSIEISASNCTFADNSGSDHLFALRDGEYSLRADGCIFAFNEGAPVLCESGPSAVFSCCDVYATASGDWVDCIEGQLGMMDNVSVDPMFCGVHNPEAPYGLQACSPCSIGCPMGAWGIECIPVAVGEPEALADHRVAATPNPSTARVLFTVRGSSGPIEIGIFDASGRCLRRIAGSAGKLVWDGTDAGGRTVPPGAYFYRSRGGAASSGGVLLRVR